MGILAAADFAVQSTYHMMKLKILGQLVFGRDMIPPINNVADWDTYAIIKKIKQIKT